MLNKKGPLGCILTVNVVGQGFGALYPCYSALT